VGRGTYVDKISPKGIFWQNSEAKKAGNKKFFKQKLHIIRFPKKKFSPLFRFGALLSL